MTWVMAACWLLAIIALAFGLAYLAGILFGTGFIAGVWSERRDQLARDARETHERYMREVRRQR